MKGGAHYYVKNKAFVDESHEVNTYIIATQSKIKLYI